MGVSTLHTSLELFKIFNPIELGVKHFFVNFDSEKTGITTLTGFFYHLKITCIDFTAFGNIFLGFDWG